MTSTIDSSLPESVNHSYSIENQEQPLIAIVTAVSEIAGVDKRDLPPLESVIDVDAVTALLKSAKTDFFGSTSSSHSDLLVKFHYDGYLVEVNRTEVNVRID